MSNTKQQWVNTKIISAEWLGQSNIFKEFERKIFSKVLLLFLHTALWEESQSQKKTRLFPRLLSKQLQSDLVF